MIYLSTEVTIGDCYVNDKAYFVYPECDKRFGGDSIVKELRNSPNGLPVRMTNTFDLNEPWSGIEEQRSILRESAPKTFKYFNERFEDLIQRNLPRG